MKPVMKNLEPMVSIAAMHDYKGFTIEPFSGGYTIILYGRMKILYIGGPAGWHMVEDIRQARAFRTSEKCHEVIDEILADHNGWVETLGGVKMTDLTDDEKKQVEAYHKGKIGTFPEVKPEGISAEQIQDIESHECL